MAEEFKIVCLAESPSKKQRRAVGTYVRARTRTLGGCELTLNGRAMWEQADDKYRFIYSRHWRQSDTANYTLAPDYRAGLDGREHAVPIGQTDLGMKIPDKYGYTTEYPVKKDQIPPEAPHTASLRCYIPDGKLPGGWKGYEEDARWKPGGLLWSYTKRKEGMMGRNDGDSGKFGAPPYKEGLWGEVVGFSPLSREGVVAEQCDLEAAFGVERMVGDGVFGGPGSIVVRTPGLCNGEELLFPLLLVHSEDEAEAYGNACKQVYLMYQSFDAAARKAAAAASRNKPTWAEEQSQAHAQRIGEINAQRKAHAVAQAEQHAAHMERMSGMTAATAGMARATRNQAARREAAHQQNVAAQSARETAHQQAMEARAAASAHEAASARPTSAPVAVRAAPTPAAACGGSVPSQVRVQSTAVHGRREQADVRTAGTLVSAQDQIDYRGHVTVVRTEDARGKQHQYTVSREDGTILDGGYGVLEFDRSNVTEQTTLEWLEGN